MTELSLGARCAAHIEQPAIAVCARCGDYYCAQCSGNALRQLCIRCAAPVPTTLYHPVSTGKFLLLTACTLSFYQLYWAYRCFQYIKRRDGSEDWPLVRAFFFNFTYFTLLADIETCCRLNEKASVTPPLLMRLPPLLRRALPIGVFVSALGSQLPGIGHLFGFCSIAFVYPAVASIAQLNRMNGVDLSKHGMKTRHWLVFAVGTCVLLLAAYGLTLPDE